MPRLPAEDLKVVAKVLFAQKQIVVGYIKGMAEPYMCRMASGEFYGGPAIRIAKLTKPFLYQRQEDLEADCCRHIDDKACLVHGPDRFDILSQSAELIIALYEHIEKYGFQPVRG